jgi:hypothetical protein
VQTERKTKKKAKHIRTPLRRKRNLPVSSEQSPKRRRVQVTMPEPLAECPPVLFVQKSAFEVKPAPIVDLTKLQSHAVLPDWRERFNNDSGIGLSSSLEVQPLAQHEPRVEDEDEDDDEAAPELSMDVIKAALQHNLSASGLDVASIKEEKLLQLVERMMSGQDLDDLLDDLVEEIHDEEDDEEADSFTKWVSSKVNASGKVQSPVQHHSELEAKGIQKADSFIDESPSRPGPSSPERQSSNYSSSRGAKRKADSPNVTPRKKANRPRDQVSAKG